MRLGNKRWGTKYGSQAECIKEWGLVRRIRWLVAGSAGDGQAETVRVLKRWARWDNTGYFVDRESNIDQASADR